MTIFTESYARLADDAYRDGTQLAGTPFTMLRTVDRSSGYHGVIYQNRVTNELVVAHRGTEPDTDAARDIVTTDLQMALSRVNQQVGGAREAVELALELAKQLGAPVTVTGHSLGGALAQITAAEYGLRGETFNAYGAAGLHGTPAGGAQVVNHMRATDLVSAAGRHFGSERVYATARDEAVLLHDRTAPDRQGKIGFFKDMIELGLDTHDIGQFYGVGSIVDTDNEARYGAHRDQFDAYRDDIRGVALGLRASMAGVSQAPPLAGLDRYLTASYLTHAALGALGHNEEIHRLQREEQHAVDARNRGFVPPQTPLVLREAAAPADGFDLQARLRHELQRYAAPDADARPLVTDAGHPQHALFEAIGRHLPAGTPPETVANVALQAMAHGITAPERLGRVAVVGEHAFLTGTLAGDRVKVALDAPTPDLQTLSDRLAQPAAQPDEPARQPQVSR